MPDDPVEAPAARRAALRARVQHLCSFAVNAREEARAVLLRALDDTDAVVRCTAVELLDWVGPAEALLPALQSADVATRRTAFQMLSHRALADSPVLRAAVLAALRDPDPAVARRAFELGGAAQFLGDAARLPQVLAMLTHPSQRVRADALRACIGQRLDVEHAEVLRAVRRALRPLGTRSLALRVLGGVEPRAVSPGLIDDVMPCLASADWRTRNVAARTIASFGRRAGRVLPEVAAAYERLASRARSGWEPVYAQQGYLLAYAALRLGGEAPWVVEALVRQVSFDKLDRDALAALEWLGPSAAVAEPVVAERAADESLEKLWFPRERDAAIAALIAIAPEAPRTHELRERFLARAPDLAAKLAARVAVFAPHPDRAARAARVLAWLAANPRLDIWVHQLARDEIDAARIAVRGALRR